MRRSAKNLAGYRMLATDGELGQVEEFYFDDQKWIIRYLVINTGEGHSGRRVLIAPGAIVKPALESRTFFVKLSMEQIRNSPDMDTDKPVSRQHEAEWQNKHACSIYWATSPGMVGMFGMPPIPAAGPPLPPSEETTTRSETASGNPHLRSTRKVTGYRLQAMDGQIGHVADFILDENKWDIRYLVVNTHKWLSRDRVCVPAKSIVRVSWDEATVYTSLAGRRIADSPPFNPARPFGVAYEISLRDWYGLPKKPGGGRIAAKTERASSCAV